MGLDLYLHKNCILCNHNKTIYSGAITYNVSPMWYYLFPGTKRMVPIEGMNGKKAAILLKHAKEKFISNKSVLEAMNPSHGFGSYDGFIDFLDELIQASEDDPELTWGAWR